MSLEITAVNNVNSTSYIDELGISIGLSRLPGETSDEYIRRLRTATRINTGQDYVGLLNEISLRLGLKVERAISLDGNTPFDVAVSLAGISLSTDTETHNIPLVTVDVDDAWTWRKLSDIVSDIDSLGLVTVSLDVDDGPSLKLAKQSNIVTTIAQPISGQDIALNTVNIITNSIKFNNPVSGYVLDTSDGTLEFSQPVLDGTTISYRRRIWPYSIITSEAALISLLDPSLQEVAQGPNGSIVYQVREMIQSIVNQDLSYWG